MAKHKPSPRTRGVVKRMAIANANWQQIGAALKISPAEARAHYAEVYTEYQGDALGKVAQALFKSAVEKGNVQAQMFYMKARGGWTEQPVQVQNNFVISRDPVPQQLEDRTEEREVEQHPSIIDVEAETVESPYEKSSEEWINQFGPRQT